MMKRMWLAVLMTAAACAPHEPRTAAPESGMAEFAPDLASLQRSLDSLVAGEEGDFGIVVLDVQTGRAAAVNQTMEFHAASTMKVPVLYELYRQASAGERSLEAPVAVRNRFRSIADTAHWYQLSATDDSEAELYGRVGQSLPLRELARRMIVVSSNLATNNLIEEAGAERVRATMERLGAGGMNVRRGVEDGPAFAAGLNNTTTAEGFARVLASLARCELLAPEPCADAVEILAQQEHNSLIPPGLPAGTRFAHKTGWITGIHHDGGIVYPADGAPFVIVVLTRRPADEDAPERVAAAAARLAWAALGPDGALRPRFDARTRELLLLHERHRAPDFVERRVAHEELWRSLEPVLRRGGFRVESLGSSAEGRALRLVHVGEGPVPVLFWSQMHGDETTATRALVDLLRYIEAEPDAPRVRRWRERLHLMVLPMLNPDGAERHTRRNGYGIDVNRDARLLVTPEGQALRAVQERYQPHYGFNLHDQNPRTRVGSSDRLAAIALLAPPPDGTGQPVMQWQRAQRLVAHVGPRIEPLVAGHLTRYDDSFNPRAFGDLMSSWGVSTILVEAGGWAADPAKRWLRAVNFVVLAEALDAIAEDAHADADVAWYRALPENGGSVRDLLIRGGHIALRGSTPYLADLLMDFDGERGTLADVGDLEGLDARDTLDAAGLFVQPREDGDWASSLNTGALPRLLLRREPADSGAIVWEVFAGRARRISR